MEFIDPRYGRKQMVRTHFGRYGNGQTALRLCTPEGEGWLTATVAVDHPIARGVITVKNYSENEGVAEILIAGGVIEAPAERFVSTGYVRVPVYRLTAAALAEISEDSLTERANGAPAKPYRRATVERQ
jgi:hypothetical protein